jgi:hypothetical protein
MGVTELRIRAHGQVGHGGDVVVDGKTRANAEVEVENASLAPYSPAGTADVFARAKAGPDGRFSVVVPGGREGDQVKLRAAGNAVSVRLQNVEPKDGRAPIVRQQGLRLVDRGDGSFSFTNACRTDVVGEPKQILRIKNTRTHAFVDVTLDGDGRLPKGARVEGKPGDTFSIATTDGTHGTALKSPYGDVCAPTPGMTEGKVEPPGAAGVKARLMTSKEPLFRNGIPTKGSMSQGELGDCWLISAVDSIVARDPRIIKNLMHDNGDGTVTVTFHRYDRERARYVEDHVTVTKQLYVNSAGTPVYGQSNDGSWFAILEKAYAAWKGGYDAAESGYPYDAFEALLGKEGQHLDLDVASADDLWSALQKNPRAVMIGWTRVDSPSLHFANSGLVSDHGYAFYGREVVNGQRMVHVRNPWGSSPWAATHNTLGIKCLANGELLVPLDVVAKMFVGVGFAKP